MAQTTKPTITELSRKASEIRRREYLVTTNSGTFGAHEACRVTGTGDPRYSTYRKYERPDGSYRWEGPPIEDAPGYARRFSPAELAADRRELKAIEAQIKAIKQGK